MSFVLAPAFVTSLAEGADPNLVGWWRFDEGSGTTVYDLSGNGNDGTLVGGATWTTGRFGGGIKLDGTSGYVSIPNFELTTDTITFAIWLNGWKGANWAPLISSREFTACEMNFGTNDTLHYTWNNDSLTTYNWTGGPVIPQDTWAMLAVTINPDGATAYVYTDAGGLKQATNSIAHIEQTVGALRIGYSYSTRYIRGIVDEAAIFSRALTAEEILGLTSGIGGGYPYVLNPYPVDGQMIAETWVNLTWRPGDFAVSHDVYLSDNFGDVNDGAAGAFQGNQAVESYIAGLPGLAYPEGLVPGTTYYWRIDEVNQADPNSPWKGPVWSFWIPPKQAYNPSPPDGARYQLPGVTLNWAGGLNAKLHTVYFGENSDTVKNAVGGTFQAAATYTPAGSLKLGKTYYWRVDEFEPPSTHKGKVWSFTTIPDIAVTDPNLIGWWTFDEGQGSTAVDWSGHKNHGELRGGPGWVDGQDGGALDFDGVDDYAGCGNGPSLRVTSPMTIAAWVYPTGNGNSSFPRIVDKSNGAAGTEPGYKIYLNATDNYTVTLCAGGTFVDSAGSLTLNAWNHMAFVVTGTQWKFSVNGTWEQWDQTALPSSSANPLLVGNSPTAVRHFRGLMDDVRIYNKALSPEELQVVMRGVPTRAGNPSPANGAVSDIIHGATLSWSPGQGISQHAVYFGTDKEAVTKADTSDTTGIYRGIQTTASYTLPQALEWDSGPYYWRVDEHTAGGIITTGTLWSFSVSDYVLVDDFESYNDIHFEQPGSNLVYLTWIDGFANPSANGATIGYVTEPSLETAIVHSGAKSVPLLYDNTAGAAFSQAERTFAPQNWTAHGLQTLSLWFCGNSTNVPGQLYIKVNGVKVPYDGADSDLTLGVWRPWTIELASIGADLQNVTSLAIGIEGVGAKGTLLLDDIRLYPYGRKLVRPVQPGDAGLLLLMALDEGSGDTAGDSSGHGKNGTLSGAAWHAGGYDGTGSSLSFGGDGDHVLVPDATYLNGLNAITICVWIKSDLTNTDQGFLIFQNPAGEDNNGMRYDASGLAGGEINVLKMSVVSTGGNQQLESSSNLQTTAWQHCAMVWSSGEQLKFYVNGILDSPTANSAAATGVTTDFEKLLLGKGSKDEGARDGWDGLIDDLRIYNHALSAGEVSWLAGRTAPFDEPF